jgi:hypothetical protein
MVWRWSSVGRRRSGGNGSARGTGNAVVLIVDLYGWAKLAQVTRVVG